MHTVEKNFDLRDLIHAVAAEENHPLNEVDGIIKSALKILREEVTKRGYVELNHFGSFKTRELAPESGHLPGGLPYSVGKRITVDFNPFIAFRDELEQFHGEPAIL